VASKLITYDDFLKVDIRTGRIISVEEFPEARNPSYKLLIDLGEEIGIRKSIAQLTVNYKPEDLQGKMVLCVVNFPPRQIGKSVSEVLTMGVPDQNNDCALVVPAKDVPAGGRLY
jgi:tRNA-binding protein